VFITEQTTFILSTTTQVYFNLIGYPYNVRVTNFYVRMNKCGLLLMQFPWMPIALDLAVNVYTS
jgi:hypothetical protein